MVVLVSAPPSLRPELRCLQGVWESVAGPRSARLLIAGRHFTFEFVRGDIYMGTFDFADGQMDLHIDEGPAEHVGLHSRCIYQLKDGEMKWCAGRPGSDKRPTEYHDGSDTRSLSFVFRKTDTNRR